MKTVKLLRTGAAANVFCSVLDRGVVFDEGGHGEVGEGTALDLLRDDPSGWVIGIEEEVAPVRPPVDAIPLSSENPTPTPSIRGKR